MKRVKVSGTGKVVREGETRTIVVDLHNSPEGIALMTRVKVVDLSSGQLVSGRSFTRITTFRSLPVNPRSCKYASWAVSDWKGCVSVQVEGWNVLPLELTQLHVK